MSRGTLLEVQNLAVTFASADGPVHAVRDCSLTLRRGELLALVGESGSGKSSVARALAGIIQPVRGSIAFRGADLASLSKEQQRAVRQRIQMVFQDPDASLNPLHRVGSILAEPLIVRRYGDRAAIRRRIEELLSLVQLDPMLLERRPRRLSGGQKQRVAIARALAMEPEVLIADEALASLDVSTGAAIAALLRDLMRRLGIAVLFISHDLATVRNLATRVAVLYGGEIVEQGPCAEVLDAPAHPYTRLLVAATPSVARRSLDLDLVSEIDRLPVLAPLAGACHYRTRCVRREQVCTQAAPLAPIKPGAEHIARCHFAGAADVEPSGVPDPIRRSS